MITFRKSKTESLIKSTEVSSEIDSIIANFSKMVESLKSKAQQAAETQIKREEEIKSLQEECQNLQKVSDRALKIANKVLEIFS